MDATRKAIRSILRESGYALLTPTWILPNGDYLPVSQTNHGEVALEFLDPELLDQIIADSDWDSTGEYPWEEIGIEGVEAAFEDGWIHVGADGVTLPRTDDAYLRRLRDYLWEKDRDLRDSEDVVDVYISIPGQSGYTEGKVPVRMLFDTGVTMQDLIRSLR